MFKASAPGSLMLLGEYAVLHGKHALVCAIDKRMTVKLFPRDDQRVTIRSALGDYETSLSTLEIVSPFQFVLAVLKRFQKKMPHGCDIIIESEFSDKVGFASSAAVTVATLSALSAWLNLSFDTIELTKTGRTIVREVQGLGSGADVAACVVGGIVKYRATPLVIQKQKHAWPLTVVYSGNKTPTVDAVAQVKQLFHSHPTLFQTIFRAIDACVLDGVQAITEQNWKMLGNIMNMQQGLLDALGVNTPLLANLLHELRQQPHILGAKISGSGLGDCIVGLGETTENYACGFVEKGAKRIYATISQQGVHCEKI